MRGDKSINETGAILLSAGLGRRMLPLTLHTPKPLLPVIGKPLFGIIIQKLIRSGSCRIFANLYHLSEKIEKFAEEKNWPIEFIQEKKLMGTGGGIGNMAGNLSRFKTILLHNSDIISNIEYAPALEFHKCKNALVTMILLGSVPPSVSLNSEGGVIKIGGDAPKDLENITILGYTGMAILSRSALDFFPRNRVYSLVDILRKMIDDSPGSVVGYNAGRSVRYCNWGEIGSIEGYLDIHRRIMMEGELFDPELLPPPLPLNIGNDSLIHPETVWTGFLQVGSGCLIKQDTKLNNCVILDNTTVGENKSIANAVIYPDGILKAGK